MASSRILFAVVCLSLTTSVLAQRGDGSSSKPSPSPRPSVSTPAPSPRPSVSTPAPAPRPSVSTPAPRPSPSVSAPAPRPAPSPRPSVGAPAPRPSNPAPVSRPVNVPPPRQPVSQPRPSVPSTTPGYSRPQPGTSPRPAPTPRTSTRNDVRPPVSAPVNPPRYSPPVEADTKPGSGRVISRPAPAADRKPVDAPSVRPTPRKEAGGEVVRAKPRGTPIDDRYRPTKPVPTPGDSKPQPGLQPRRPSDLPPTSNRYKPADTTSPTSATRRPVPIAGGSAGSVATPVRKPASTAPNLAPRSGAPRLSAPRANVRPITSAVSARYQRGSYSSHCHPTYWRGYWDPCYDTWGHCHSWGFGAGFGSYGWQLSFYYPFWACRSLWWNHCYHDTLWSSWSNPYCATTSYWWYPGSVYCPSYLYVPSTVVVYETSPAVEVVPAGGSSEVVVAGGGVVGSARSVEAGPGTESLAQSLAVKYVELGDFYFRAGRYDDAAEAYGKARSYTPEDASVHFVLADAVFATGGWHYAAFLIAEGLRLEPALASATTDKRTFYGNAADFDAQMAALDNYLDKNPYDAQAMLVRGYNLAFSLRPADALAMFDRVLSIEPENRAATLFVKALRPAPEKVPSVF